MKVVELKSLVYAKLIARGLTVQLNHRVRLSSVKGFQQINLDIVAVNAEKKPFIAIYIGPKKERKLMKYKLTHIQYLELSDESRISSVVEQFLQIYIDKFY